MTEYDDYGIPADAYSESESLTHQAWRVARAFALYRVKPELGRRWRGVRSGGWSFRRVLSVVNVLIGVWWVVLYLGERSAIRNAVEACRWEKWENWEEGANPHRLIFVADPQLIDPHTYPGRPWPLNDLTIRYVDQYLRRTYSRIQEVLYPDTVFFLGDLFDGGREWSTHTHTNPNKMWAGYGDDFWMNEYRRFGRIFFAHWGDGGLDGRPGQPGRKLIGSLPGNHDLGFAKGVDPSVRDRFHAYFGEGNRIDIVGNHTFVSIDSVSLSALGQANPQTVEHLWKPTLDFLDNAKTQKKRLVQRELRIQQGLPPYPGFPHKILEKPDLPTAKLPHADNDVTDFPTILLSHVPLFRKPGTPCGPLREKYPPSPVPKGAPPLEKDHRNAISVSAGEQYQNVLNPEITVDIANRVGDIRYAFSGDDHDYCEVLHHAYTSGGGGIREITVKSLSWAMGVRHPGMVMLSLWNPVSTTGAPLSGDAAGTVQSKLCLMPDQLGVFIRYAALFGVTLVILAIRATLLVRRREKTDAPLLPTSSAAPEKSSPPHTHSSNSSSSSNHAHLQNRTPQSRTRGVSPQGGYGLPSAQTQTQTQPQTQHQSQPNTQTPTYTYPLVQHAGSYVPSGGAHEEKRRETQARAWGNVSTKGKGRGKGKEGFWKEFGGSLGTVAGAVFAWYFWLVWRW